MSKDMLAGLLFVAIGLCAIILAQDYPFGTARSMGSGYVPTLVGGLMVVLGGALFLFALLHRANAERPGRFALRPSFFVLSSVIAFAVLVRPLGLIAAIVAVVILARLANRHSPPIEVAIQSVVVTTICVALFVYGLHMPFQLGPWR